jgi:hypothetical protein
MAWCTVAAVVRRVRFVALLYVMSCLVITWSLKTDVPMAVMTSLLAFWVITTGRLVSFRAMARHISLPKSMNTYFFVQALHVTHISSLHATNWVLLSWVGFRTDQEVKMAFFWKVTPWTLVDIY